MRTGINKYIGLGIASLILSTTMMAQESSRRDERREQMESKKVAYCTERAGLTTEEASAYWSLRNEIDDQKREIRKDSPRRKDIDPETMSDQELRDAMKERLANHIKAEQLELDNMDKLMDVVGAKKFALIQKAEREFKKEVLRDLRDKRGGFRERGPRGPRAPEAPEPPMDER